MYRTKRTNINAGWQFSYAGETQTVELPHSWNAFDTMDTDPARHYRRGVGIYQRDLTLPDLPDGGRRFLQIEAASQKARVELSSKLLGSHAGGYTAFDLELPPIVKGFSSGDEIPLTIQVDNRPNPDLIPSDMSDFFLYGGLTRNVWLYQTGPLRLASLHFEIDLEPFNRAGITLNSRLDGEMQMDAVLQVVIQDSHGEIVLEHLIETHQPDVVYKLPPLEDVQRWSPDAPILYKVETTVLVAGQVSDQVVEKIGFRTFDFPAGGPFYLNGKCLLLRGTHRHEDWAGCASAVPDEWTRREMEQIKAAGFNFIRLGHYPQAPAVLQACDELGLIVWEELPWCRGGVGGNLFKAQTRAMLHEMIDQHYNHPSIIFWGLGNELDWESEHPGSSDEAVAEFLSELHKLSHSLDPSRLTALRRFEPGAEIVDVYSPSIWSGWYAGRYGGYETVLSNAIQKYPRMLHMEWGGDSHVGRHASGDHLKQRISSNEDHSEQVGIALSEQGPARGSRDSDWSESYMLDLMEWHLQVQERLLNLAGTAQWAFKDFGTPLRPENPIPYVNQKGLVDRNGDPKDVYYLFQSYQSQIPVCYIESPTWSVRNGDDGMRNRIRVISNCHFVELIANGVSFGTKIRNPREFPAGGLIWFVPYALGRNKIQAIGITYSGERVEHVIEQEYVPCSKGEPVDFIWHWGFVSEEENVLRFALQLVDSQNIPVLDDERRVRFDVQSGSCLLGLQGTPDGSQIVETANGSAEILVAMKSLTIEMSVQVDDCEPKLVRMEIV